jgi:predicted acyltransferase
MNTLSRRADALDALRGLAILLMVLSGSIHFPNPLPAWMYHAQVPPPDFKFDPNLPGITWVDLVFPFFLFAMGAAFPFGIAKKLDSGVSRWTIVLQIVQRGLMLVAFAIFLQHTKPFLFSSDPGPVDWAVGLLSFAVMFLCFVRYPQSLVQWQRYTLRTIGILGAAAILLYLTFPDGSGFLLTRSDIIIIVLANVAVFGSLLWIYTRNNLLLRLGILGILIALRLTQNIEGSWNQWLWNATPFPWMYKLYYLQYLCIVIPGTIVGDMIYDWIKSERPEPEGADGLSRMTMFRLLAVLMTVIVVTVAGLFVREIIVTIVLNALLLIAAHAMFRSAHRNRETLYRSLFNWGTFWLVLGFFFEAYEGGIKKDRATVSYYFVTAGLAVYATVCFSIIAEFFAGSRIMRLLIDNGKNPMIAYVAGNVLILPILSLTSLTVLMNYLTVSPWLGFVKGVIFTLLVAIATQFFTKKELYWRT